MNLEEHMAELVHELAEAWEKDYTLYVVCWALMVGSFRVEGKVLSDIPHFAAEELQAALERLERTAHMAQGDERLMEIDRESMAWLREQLAGKGVA